MNTSPIHECVAYERLWFKLQTFHFTNKRTQQLAMYLIWKQQNLNYYVCVLYLYKVNCY